MRFLLVASPVTNEVEFWRPASAELFSRAFYQVRSTIKNKYQGTILVVRRFVGRGRRVLVLLQKNGRSGGSKKIYK